MRGSLKSQPITPRSALKFDLFAQASRNRKIDEVGDPLQVIAEHIDFAALANLVGVFIERSDGRKADDLPISQPQPGRSRDGTWMNVKDRWKKGEADVGNDLPHIKWKTENGRNQGHIFVG